MSCNRTETAISSTTSSNSTALIELGVAEWWQELDDVILSTLPALNSAATRDAGCIPYLFKAFDTRLAGPELSRIAGANISPRLAREIIGAIAFPSASVEAHLQRVGQPVGSGYKLFPGLIDNLMKLSRMAQHPPTHSHLTYWTYNDREKPRTFTGSVGEIHFNRAVNLTRRMKECVSDQLRPIVERRICLDDPEATARIRIAIEAYHSIQQTFVEYKRPEAAGCPIRMPQKAFLTGMRPFLVETEIAGTRYTGPNAANILSWIETDFLIGFRAPFYEELLRRRYLTMLPEEPERVETFMKRKSMITLISDRIGIDENTFSKAGLAELVKECRALPRSAQVSIREFGRLALAARTTSMIHFSYIKYYVQKAELLLSESEKKAALVQGSKGVSGSTIDEGAARIAAMRKDHPSVSQLIELGRRLDDSDPEKNLAKAQKHVPNG